MWIVMILGIRSNRRHRNRLAPGGLAFQSGDVLAQNLQSHIDVLDCHWKIVDLIASNQPLEVLHGQVTHSLVQSSCELCTLNLPLRETFLVFRKSVDESKMLFVPCILIV
jgi:hypothetical protein